MRRGLALVLLMTACGSAPPPRAAGPSTAVEVPGTDEEEPPAEDAPESEPARAEGSSLEECARRLRADPIANPPPADAEAYRRAHELEGREDLSEARKAYYDIIANRPTSPYVPVVYLAFAELFKRDAESDPSKWDLAGQAYREVLKYPPPNNPVYAYASLRLAQVDRAKQDFAQSLSGYKKVFEAIAQHPDLACAGAMLDAAQAGMVEAYAETGAPDKAWAFFSHVDRERGQSLLADLVKELERRGKKSEACAAARSNPSSSGACR